MYVRFKFLSYCLISEFILSNSLFREPVSGSLGSRSLRSSERGLLSVLFARTTIMQSRACSVVAPTVWNGLPPALGLLPRTLSDTFYNQLKTVLFDRAGVGSTSE